MSEAGALLRRKADEWKALGEEHCGPGDPFQTVYFAVWIVLRELADAVELVLEEKAA